MTKKEQQTASLEFPDNRLVPLLYGEHNSNLAHLEKELGVKIADRGNTIKIQGSEQNVMMGCEILEYLYSTLEEGKDEVDKQDINSALRFAKKELVKPNPKHEKGKPMASSDNVIKLSKRDIKARSPNQEIYIEALHKSDMIFGIGPAGTGKTYLAVAMAVSLYEKGEVERMIFCRPAVEAGEKLGFLPGDLKEKIDPYLMPIYDALYDFLGVAKTDALLEKGAIEIAPLAFMRGRTLSRASVVLDEAQNTTSAQMKMFLSRMGEGAKLIITGDPHQIDLLDNQVSGLKEASAILREIEEVSFIEFDYDDVVRHHLVSKILKAYDKSHHGY